MKNGFASLTSWDHAYAVIVQRDRKLVVAGSSGTLPNTDFVLARYNDDGTLDLAFGDGGKVTTDLLGHDDFAYAIVHQPNGKLVVAGVTSPTGSEYDFALARYTSAGELDTSFGMEGLTVTEVGDPDRCFAVALRIRSAAGIFSWCLGTTTCWRNRSARWSKREK